MQETTCPTPFRRPESMRNLSLLFCVLFLWAIGARSQAYSYIHYTEKDGLPSSIIYDICQDKEGFIWLATENGVTRFDGTHFRTFTTRDGLPDNAVLKIFCARDGRIWVSPFMHYPHYYEKGRFRPIDLPEQDRKKLYSAIYFGNIDNFLVIGSNWDKDMLLVDHSRLSTFEAEYPSLPAAAIPFELSPSLMIAVVDDSVFVRQGNKFVFNTLRTGDESITGMGPDGKVILLDSRRKGKVFPRGYADTSFFYGTDDNGVSYFNNLTGEQEFRIDVKRPSNSMIDRENAVWIATLGNGLYRYPSLAFTHNRLNKEFPELFSLEKINGKVVCGDGYNTLFTVPDGKVYANFYRYLAQTSNTPAQASGQNRIYKLLTYGNNLYACTDAFLIKVDPQGRETFRNIFPLKDISIDGNDLLLSAGPGVYLLRADDFTVTDTLWRQRATTGIIHGADFFIGTTGGLIRINRVTRELTRLDKLNPSLAKRITSLKTAPDGSLWISTSGAGLFQYRNGQIIRQINTTNGLSGDICTSMFIDQEVLWTGTNRGLNRIQFDKDSFRITQFTTADGLSSNIVNAIYADSSMVYVAGPEGVNTFSKEYTQEKSICILHLLQVSAGDSILNEDSVYHFRHDIMNLRFDFVAVSFKSAGDISYFYQMEGLDKRWYSTSNTFLTYATLPPGTYTLRLKAVNKFGVESEVRSVTIIISPPWWKTWWFIIGAFLATATAIYLLYRRRIRMIKKEEAHERMLQQQFAGLEQQALQAQMNPHFIFNCLNSIQSFVIRHDVEGASRYLSGFASLIRQTLDNSSEEMITLASEARYIETYLSLEKTRLDNKFDYRVSVNGVPDPHAVMIPAMLVQPYVENALRHGLQHLTDKRGLITVDFTGTAGGDLVCTVKDNGVGRKKAAELKSKQHIEYMSKGTAITAKRIEVLNNQYNTGIRVQTEDIPEADGMPGGTAVVIVFPGFVTKKETV